MCACVRQVSQSDMDMCVSLCVMTTVEGIPEWIVTTFPPGAPERHLAGGGGTVAVEAPEAGLPGRCAQAARGPPAGRRSWKVAEGCSRRPDAPGLRRPVHVNAKDAAASCHPGV